MSLSEKSIIVLNIEILEKDLSFLSHLVLEKHGSIRGFEEYIINSFNLETLNYPSELATLLLMLHHKNKYSVGDTIGTIICFLEDELYKRFHKEITDFQVILHEKESLEFYYQYCKISDFKNLENGNIECGIYSKFNSTNVEKIKTHIITIDDIQKRKEEIVSNQIDIISEYLKDSLELFFHNMNFNSDINKIKKLINFEPNYADEEYKNLKYYQQQKIIDNTLKKVQGTILISILNKEIRYQAFENLQELKIKIYNPKNIKKHEQLKSFVSFIVNSNIGLVYEEYLPILADIIIAKYLIEDMLLFPQRCEKNLHLSESDKLKMADTIIFNQIINKKNIHKYVLTYFAKEFHSEFNNMRLLYRYVLYVDSQKQKNFIKERIQVLPAAPINLKYHYSRVENKNN